MRSNDGIADLMVAGCRPASQPNVTEFGTESGPTCPHCDGTIWLYRVYPGDADWGNSVTARCVGCKCAEMWDDKRGTAHYENVIEVRERHEERRKLALAGQRYALARTFIVRHSMPHGNLQVLAYYAKQAELIALFQDFGGPVKYVHADDPLDWTTEAFKIRKPIPCCECGQDIPAEECAPGWGFVQLHKDCKMAASRRTLTDLPKRIAGGF